ncbi:hypothetical protein Dsin_025031 [Dipteronia sinensis]|uniref:Chlorophyllase n=1 Tax=Dipteronia sinensis TaxID=43782 RepID=A0AAD9ZV91_9ROSI|nr:hypothetical protein Dsin_025031 [Dipteronia sinensis]
MAAVVEAKPNESAAELLVFNLGSHTTTVETSNKSSPPKPMFIVSPIEQGSYPVILFFPDTCISNNAYSQLFQHISSHGFIVVSPQLYSCMPPCGNNEVDFAAQVTNWLPKGLKSNLPENVEADLNKLVLSGHSRGGTIAFALSLGYACKTRLDQFSALVAVDPVGGTTKCTELNPSILSNNPFNLSFPVTVIGTGLGGVTKCIIPCAPESANHEKFYERSKAPKAHFVTKEYGHMVVLDDSSSNLRSWVMSKCMCAKGKGPREAMRRTVGGIAVAFLKDLFSGNLKNGVFMKIVQDPSVAPAVLDDVDFVQARNYVDFGLPVLWGKIQGRPFHDLYSIN